MTMSSTKIEHNFHFYKPTMNSPTFTSDPTSVHMGSVHEAQHAVDLRKTSQITYQNVGKCRFCSMVQEFSRMVKKWDRYSKTKLGLYSYGLV